MEKPVVDYVDCAANIVGEVHFNIAPREDAQQQSIGHILVFLTGTEEIAQACDLIRKVAKDLLVLPMHAAQSQAQNRLVFQETKERKCIVSTNVAETSITIPGVAYVVDCGLVKRGMYNPRCGMEMLDTVLISEASANQRKGRAGRTRPGTCFRLYTKETFLGFPKSSMPGIHTEDLMTIVLKLRASGRDNIMALDWLEPPPIENVLRASNLLWH
jgi:HrpA-like RNA helicase